MNEQNTKISFVEPLFYCHHVSGDGRGSNRMHLGVVSTQGTRYELKNQ